MREIPVGMGKVACVDDADYELVTRYLWHASGHPGQDGLCYAKARIDGRSVTMHQLILQQPCVIHRNHDGLDNRRHNLCAVPSSQRTVHARKTRKPTSSRYKGVSWNRRRKQWRAQIQVNGRMLSLGYFTTEEAAALAYDRTVRRYRGELAYVNFPGASGVAALS
jgi:hypothetical protein